MNEDTGELIKPVKTIWKHEFNIDDTIKLKLPKHSKILSCQVQNEVACIWYLCDPRLEKQERTLILKGTGHPIWSNEEGRLKFIDTIQFMEGRLVFHVFELCDKDE